MASNKTIDIDIWNKLNPKEQAAINALLKAPIKPNLLKDSFPEQTAFINDSAKLKALFGTRRMAKSYTAGLYLLKTALDRPSTSSVYIALTRDTAKRIIWSDVFKTIIKKYNISAKLNESELTITLDNGSIIYILGIDDSEQEKDKLLGKKYALAVIDEAASYSINLQEVIYKVLKPAMSDLAGTICLIGTADNNKTGIFYELTKDLQVNPPQRKEKDGWSIHSWSTVNNPYMCKQWEETLKDLKLADPYVEDQTWFKQHYLGQWVTETSAKIYKYDSSKNSWNGKLPDHGWKAWQYVLGIDLGWEDASAFVVLGYHEHDPNVYIIKAAKHKRLTLSEVADKIREYMGEYPINYFIVDGAAKQGVEEIIKHHQLPLQYAEKTGKTDFIRIMNSDFISGKIKVSDINAEPLIEEYDLLLWDKRSMDKGIFKEAAGFHGDCSDAALYAYRYCYHYMATPDKVATRKHMSDVERTKLEWAEELEKKKSSADPMMEGSEYLFY